MFPQMALAAGVDEQGETGFSAGTNEDGAVVGIIHAADGSENVDFGPNPLEGCNIVSGLSGADAIDYAGAFGILVGITNPEMEIESDATYVFISCPERIFGNFRWAVWEEGEDVPGDVVDALTAAARSALVIPALIPETAPDGLDTPFLTQLPVWLWVPAEDWVANDGTASLPGLGLWITATATPVTTDWATGSDDDPTIQCEAGTPWEPGLDDDATDCSVTYGTTTPPGTTFDLSVSTTYDVEFTCSPGLCPPAGLPGEIFTVTVARPVTVTEARGVISR